MPRDLKLAITGEEFLTVPIHGGWDWQAAERSRDIVTTVVGCGPASMHVLQLVTNEKAPFFTQQLESLEERGVTAEVRSPAGGHSSTESRSLSDYVRLAIETVRDSPDRFDVIHANYGLTGPAALGQQDVPVILSLWGSDLLGRFGPLAKACARRADEVVVMTDAMAAVLDQPCHVIPHGVDLETFEPIPQEVARNHVGWGADAYHVLFPYSPDRHIKDFPRATRVVADVEQRLGETITLQTVSGVAHDEMPAYYNAADALLLTSKREGSPNVVKEALACNTPVVATAVGDVPTRLQKATLSRACSAEPPLVEALATALTSEKAPNGRELAGETSAEQTAERLEAVYKRAVGDAGSSSHQPKLRH